MYKCHYSEETSCLRGWIHIMQTLHTLDNPHLNLSLTHIPTAYWSLDWGELRLQPPRPSVVQSSQGGRKKAAQFDLPERKCLTSTWSSGATGRLRGSAAPSCQVPVAPASHPAAGRLVFFSSWEQSLLFILSAASQPGSTPSLHTAVRCCPLTLTLLCFLKRETQKPG